VNREDRAKQFMPFDALKGLQEELRKKEIEYEDRIELTESGLEVLENQFIKLEKGNRVKIKYYRNGRYNYIEGNILNIDYNKKRIKIDENIINLCDVNEIYRFD